jgi:hypothetical protein
LVTLLFDLKITVYQTAHLVRGGMGGSLFENLSRLFKITSANTVDNRLKILYILSQLRFLACCAGLRRDVLAALFRVTRTTG